jgi:Family of unknown function (DUF6091)
MQCSIKRLLTAWTMVLAAGAVQAGQKFCVFDFLGTSGDAYGMSKDYALAMQRYGVDVELKAYTSEAVATEDFRTGNCDAFIATAFRTRQFNAVAASIDSFGATTIVRQGVIDMPASYEVLRKLIQTYSTPSPLVSKLMVQGEFEVGGIVPIGPAYPFVNDRRINSIEALAGKRIAAFDYDKAQAVMIQRIGAQPVSADVSNVHTKFNNGLVDMIALPTLAYRPLELYKGLGTKGGVGRFPIMIATYQVIFKRARFPDGFGEVSRAYWLSQFDRVLQLIRTGDASIPPAQWIEINPDAAAKYTLMLREARIQLAQQGLYDKRGLKVIKRIRCHVNLADSECATKSEEEWK